jgi:hypothetical protein
MKALACGREGPAQRKAGSAHKVPSVGASNLSTVTLSPALDHSLKTCTPYLNPAYSSLPLPPALRLRDAPSLKLWSLSDLRAAGR